MRTWSSGSPTLDAEARATLAVVPEANRKLVTGHESMGYFADRYAFTLVGHGDPRAELPGRGLAPASWRPCKTTIEAAGRPGDLHGDRHAGRRGRGDRPRDRASKVVELPSHTLPDDGSYFSFIRQIATAVTGALR